MAVVLREAGLTVQTLAGGGKKGARKIQRTARERVTACEKKEQKKKKKKEKMTLSINTTTECAPTATYHHPVQQHEQHNQPLNRGGLKKGGYLETAGHTE